MNLGVETAPLSPSGKFDEDTDRVVPVIARLLNVPLIATRPRLCEVSFPLDPLIPRETSKRGVRK